jgi:hypothetical protein
MWLIYVIKKSNTAIRTKTKYHIYYFNIINQPQKQEVQILFLSLLSDYMNNISLK